MALKPGTDSGTGPESSQVPADPDRIPAASMPCSSCPAPEGAGVTRQLAQEGPRVAALPRWADGSTGPDSRVQRASRPQSTTAEDVVPTSGWVLVAHFQMPSRSLLPWLSPVPPE